MAPPPASTSTVSSGKNNTERERRDWCSTRSTSPVGSATALLLVPKSRPQRLKLLPLLLELFDASQRAPQPTFFREPALEVAQHLVELGQSPLGIGDALAQ